MENYAVLHDCIMEIQYTSNTPSCIPSGSQSILLTWPYAISLQGYKTCITKVTDKKGNWMNGNMAEWGIPLRRTGCLETECASAQEIGLCLHCAYVFVCILTVCLGTGGSADGLFVSAPSLRMWSVLMYESYRPSPWRAGNKNEQINQRDNQIINSATKPLRDKSWENTQTQHLQNEI